MRVQIRVAGHEEFRNFPLTSDDTAERHVADAEAWASETRCRILGGSHVSAREAGTTTLAAVLQRYEREGLAGDPANVAEGHPRIAVLLRGPIARKSLAQLRKTDIAALRDRVLHVGSLRNLERAAVRIEEEGDGARKRYPRPAGDAGAGGGQGGRGS